MEFDLNPLGWAQRVARGGLAAKGHRGHYVKDNAGYHIPFLVAHKCPVFVTEILQNMVDVH